MCKKFIESVEYYCEGIIVAVGCRGSECEYADGDENHQCETHFSWSSCDSCGSTFGGDRVPATWYDPDTDEIYEMEICIDCAMFHANGELPETWEQHPER